MSELPFPALTREVRCRYTAKDAISLPDFLASRFNYLSREEWCSQILAGNLSVNQQPARVEQILQQDAVLQFTPRALTEPPVSWNVQILFEDKEILILNKPGNLPCHPAGAFFNHTLWAWLKQCKKLKEVHFCNRLDRETSGIVMVGKNSVSARWLNHALKQPDARKEYLVLVQGQFPKNRLCSGWLIPDPDSPVRKKRRFLEKLPAEMPQAEDVSTSFSCLAYHPKTNISLLQATLNTGRMHQIRATLFSLGYPVPGDKLYGVDDRLFLKLSRGGLSSEDCSRLLMPRQALHSWKIQFSRPDKAVPERYTAPLPEDIRFFLEQIHFPLSLNDEF